MNIQLIYENILKSNIINFLIMVSILVLIFKKYKLGAFVDLMSEEIKNNVDISQKSVENVLKKYKEIKHKAKETPKIQEEIIDNSKNLIKKLNEKNTADILKKQKDMEDNLNKTKQAAIEFKFQKTAKSVQEAIYLSSIDTIKNMLNYDIQKKIIFDSLDEIKDFSIKKEQI